jgi:hypothetical protein
MKYFAPGGRHSCTLNILALIIHLVKSHGSIFVSEPGELNRIRRFYNLIIANVLSGLAQANFDNLIVEQCPTVQFHPSLVNTRPAVVHCLLHTHSAIHIFDS